MKRQTAIVYALVTAALLLATAPMWASDDTTGRVSIESRSVAVGIGSASGEGVLEYRGQSYPFSVTGLSVGAVGLSRTSAQGEVRNLKSVEDFAGTYVAAKAGGTVGGGVSGAVMQNHKDVQMVLTGTSQGVSFSFAPSGVTVKLEPSQAAKQPAAAPRPTQ